MQVDFQNVKQIVDDIVLTESDCIDLMCFLLARENEILQNATVDKIVSVLKKWHDTPHVEILKELSEFQDQQNTT